MKKLLIILLMLCAGIAGAQSDCTADQCGSIPLMGVFDTPDWNTDLFLKVEGVGIIYFRLREVPASPFIDHVFTQMDINGSAIFGVYDLVNLLYGDAEYDGTILLDWATFDDPMEVEVLPLLRKNGVLAGVTLSYLVPPGCHQIPVPWSGGATTIAFQMYNPSESMAQTMTIDGGELLVVESSPIGDEKLMIVEAEYNGAFVEICTGVDYPGSGGGVNLDQEVWVLPRFMHAGDRVTTRVW